MNGPKPYVSVIVPCFNEQDNIENCVIQLERAFHPTQISHEILLVNDGSTDDTLGRASQLSLLHNSVRVIDLGANFGKAIALKEGVRRAKGDLVAFFDADLQYAANDLILMVSKLNNGIDFVNGRRNYNGYGGSRTAFSLLYNKIVRFLFRTELNDSNCGIKVLKREALEGGSIFLYGLPLVVPLLKMRGFESTEFPVNLHERRNGESKYFNRESFLGGWNNIRDISYHSGMLLGLLISLPSERIRAKKRERLTLTAN